MMKSELFDHKSHGTMDTKNNAGNERLRFPQTYCETGSTVNGN